MRRLRPLALAALLCVALGAGPLVTIDLPPDVAIDAPSDWLTTPDALARQAFFTRPGAAFEHALHPSGSRASDLPYAIVERTGGLAGVPTTQQQLRWAEAMAATFAVAMSPPSKADRPPAWTRAKVTKPRVYRNTARFEFEATLSYDSGGDRTVRVAGVFGTSDVVTVAIWSDSTYEAQHAAELSAMQSSFRFATPIAPPPTIKEAFLSKTRWFFGFVIAGVVGLQIFVLVRERRERQAAGAIG